MQCASCGVSILDRTARKYNGVCAPCYRTAVTEPADTFEIPQELLDDRAAEYRRWFPVLRAFAADCRQAVPAERVEALAPAPRAQYGILRTKMREFAESEDGLHLLAPRPDHVTVLSVSGVALAAEEELFSGSGVVILEDSERDRWFSEVYRRGSEAPWWFAFVWWTVKDRTGVERSRRDSTSCTTCRTGSSNQGCSGDQ
jgi:hypothetical protein